MRIVIDGFPLRIGSAGIGTYTLELLGALTRVAPSHDYYLADFGARLSAAKVRSGPEAGDCRDQARGLVARVPLAWKAVPFSLRRAVIRAQAAGLGADLYLGTNFLGVFHQSFRTMITVHDMSHVHYPHATHPFMSRKLAKDLPGDADRAHAILVDSEATKRDVVAHLRVPRSKVHVVFAGVSDLFRPVVDEHLREDCRLRHALPARFLLYVGTVEPRKNIARLLEAFRLLTEDPSFEHDLVIAGGKGWRDEAIRRLLARFPRKERVILTGWVARDDLPILYSMADAFVFPSLYEGFGLPVLEAMACGTPVITSAVSSLPEVAGGAALLVDPGSSEDIATAVRRLVGDASLAESLRRKGRLRAGAFSWEASARRVLEVFAQILRA